MIATFALVLAACGEAPESPEAARHARIIAMADAWSGEVGREAGVDALDPTAPIARAAEAAAFDPADDYWGLPRTPGHEEVAGFCAACHSLRLVMQQRFDAEGWSALVARMIEDQGMPEPYPEDRDRIVAYLAEHFPDSPEE